MEEKFDMHEKRNAGEIRDKLRCDYKASDLTENKEDLTLIWLDKLINNSADFLTTFEKIHELIDYVLLYTNLQKFIDCVQFISKEKVFLIISPEMAEAALSSMQTMDTIISIFIYNIDNKRCEIDFSQYSNNVITCNDQNSLIETVREHVCLFSKQTVTFSLFDNTKESSFRDLSLNPASFLWFRLLLDVFQQFSTTLEAENEMIDVCKKYYHNNDIYLQQINEFHSLYQASDAVYWYTKNGFIYKLMNKAFRIDDMLLLYLFRFYIIDLCKQLEIISKNSFLSATTIKLYRGRPIREEELDILKANLGNLISPNGFLSTTTDLDVALPFAGEDSDRKKSTIFEITVEQSKLGAGTIVAADIKNFSHFPQEKEVLFNVGSTFRIDTVAYRHELQKWYVQMTATDDGLTYVQEHINSMRKDLAETNPTRLFGKLLIDMGQYSKAEQYYELILQKVPENHDDFPSLCHGLGYTYYVRDQFEQALKYDQAAYEVRKRTLPENHLDIARSSLNLGCDYLGYGNYQKAEELLMEALRIRKLNYSGNDHANIAIVLGVIGDNYTHLGDYEKAYDYLMKALQMFERVYTVDHADIVRTLVRLGYYFESQHIYERAIECYCDAHTMAAKIMPSEHPRLQKYFENIIKLYQKMNRTDKAIQFCNEKLSRQRAFSGEQHRNIAQNYEILGDLSSDR